MQATETYTDLPVQPRTPYRIIVGNNPVNFVDPMGLAAISVFPPGFDDGSPIKGPGTPDSGCGKPDNDCIKDAKKVRKICTTALWGAQAKCTAICAVACIGSTAGYPACFASCAYACHRGFAIGRAGCWATYALMIQACDRSN